MFPSLDQTTASIAENRRLARLIRLVQGIVSVFGGLLIAAVFYASGIANQAAAEREHQLIENALDYRVTSALRDLKALAWWDEAVRHIQIHPDRNWMQREMHLWMRQAPSHCATYILDGRDRLIYAVSDRQYDDPTTDKPLPSVIAPVLDQVRGRASRPMRNRHQDFDRNEVGQPGKMGARWAAQILHDGNRLLIVTAITVAPHRDPSLLQPGPAPVLIGIWPLETQMFRRLGAAILVDDLHLSRSPAGSDHALLMTDDGQPVGYLSWRGRKPGEPIRTFILPALALGVIATCIILSKLMTRLRLASDELTENAEQARQQALHDALSNLPNRRHFMASLAKCLSSGKASQLLVAYIDVDHFKDVNDAIGHAAGDALVVEVGRRLHMLLRDDDLLARLGGDEFAVIRTMANDERPERLGETLMAAFAAPFHIADNALDITASIGLASATRHHEPDRLLQDADISLYRAKEQGRARFVLFTNEMADEVRDRHQLATDLRAAIGSDQIRIHYQPIVSARTGLVNGVEALVRWMHPQRGEVPPERFIQIAEQTGLMVALGDQIFDLVFRDAAFLPDVDVAINLSPLQLRQPELPEQLARRATRFGVVPARIVLEVTETLLIEADEGVMNIFNTIRGQGFKTALDDFGTGYSSLSYLHRFHFDRLKIDRSFVRSTATDKLIPIIQAVVHIGRGLRIQTVAEGVETAAEMAMLHAIGVGSIQGYLISRPLPLEEVITFIERNRTSPLRIHKPGLSIV